MRRDELSEIYQLSGFSYYTPISGNFITFYPTDLFMGSFIDANSKELGIEELIYPYSLKELQHALKISGRDRVLNSRILDIKPCEDDSSVSKEFVATVRSMSTRDVTRHTSVIRHYSDLLRVEFRCTCGKKFRNRDIRGVWSPIVLTEWEPVLKGNKHYLEAICPHTAGEGFRIRDDYGVKMLGFDDGLDYMKPYLLVYIDALTHAPKFRDYVFDIIFTYHSSLFQTIKKNVNEMRKSLGLGNLIMYDYDVVKAYMKYRLIKGGYKERKLNELINLVKKI